MRLAARLVRMHARRPAVTAFIDAALSSATPEWPTPGPVFAALASEFGPFDLDPCATADNAKCARYYTMADDGLSQPWKGRVWLNPPYGRHIGAWLARARQAAADGALVVCLVPARTDTRWWRETAPGATLVRFWPGRIRFGADPAPFPSAVIVLGEPPGRQAVTGNPP